MHALEAHIARLEAQPRQAPVDVVKELGHAGTQLRKAQLECNEPSAVARPQAVQQRLRHCRRTLAGVPLAPAPLRACERLTCGPEPAGQRAPLQGAQQLDPEAFCCVLRACSSATMNSRLALVNWCCLCACCASGAAATASAAALGCGCSSGGALQTAHPTAGCRDTCA
jgi:hypothetical protein